jgi:hypothetical protein
MADEIERKIRAILMPPKLKVVEDVVENAADDSEAAEAS